MKIKAHERQLSELKSSSCSRWVQPASMRNNGDISLLKSTTVQLNVPEMVKHIENILTNYILFPPPLE